MRNAGIGEAFGQSFIQPLQGWGRGVRSPRVALRLPWALLFDPFGVRKFRKIYRKPRFLVSLWRPAVQERALHTQKRLRFHRALDKRARFELARREPDPSFSSKVDPEFTGTASRLVSLRLRLRVHWHRFAACVSPPSAPRWGRIRRKGREAVPHVARHGSQEVPHRGPRDESQPPYSGAAARAAAW